MGFWKKTLAVFLAITLAVTMAPFPIKHADAATTSFHIPIKYGQTEARSMLKMINDFRASNAKCWNEDNTAQVTYSGLAPLSYDFELEKVAMLRAAEIALSFGHTRPNGQSCFSAFPDDLLSCAENIAAGQRTANSVFVDWCEDNERYDGQGHRRNMLSSYVTSVGIGHAYVNGTHYWVQNFGGPTSNSAYTVAQDDTRSVKVDIDSSNISSKSMVLKSNSIEVSPGASASLPTANISLRIRNNWPSGEFDFVTRDLIWTSSNPSVAVISGNTVIGKKAGSATLTASSNGMSAKVALTVFSKPRATSIKSLKPSKRSMIVKWNKVKNVSGYEIWCSTSKKFAKKGTVKKMVKKPKATSLKVSKLKKGKTYHVKVRTFSKSAGKTFYSKWSKVKKVKIRR